MNRKKKAVVAVVAVIAAVIVMFFVFISLEGRPVDSNSSRQTVIQVKTGSTTSQIADLLKSKGLIRSTAVFRLQSKISGFDGKYCAGYYAFTKKMSEKEMMSDIASGKTAGKTFQIIQGQSLAKIAVQLQNQGICSKKQFFNEVKNGKFSYKFMKYLPSGANRLEGFLWPDTYTISVRGGAHEAINVMLKKFDSELTSKYYKAAKKNGINIYKLVTLASIVEREASISKDKPYVASVIYNRLHKNMYLQMDSIIAYITGTERVIATYGDISVKSKYNPYKYKGLPPGPICSPGKTALDAAADPANSDYLYFVTSSKLDGSLAFSKTADQFAKDKAAFEKAYKKSKKSN